MTKIKAILWDYGNVLVKWSPRDFYKSIINDEQKLDFFLNEVCPMSWHELHDKGQSMDVTIPKRQKEFPEFSKEIQMWKDDFAKMLFGEISGSIEIVKQLQAMGMPQYILTNMPSELVDICFEPFDLKKYFKDIIVTGDEKIAKPDPAIFELSLKRLGDLSPEEVFFTDDSKPNIITAQKMGFACHLFEGANGLNREMQNLGILPK